MTNPGNVLSIQIHQPLFHKTMRCCIYNPLEVPPASILAATGCYEYNSSFEVRLARSKCQLPENFFPKLAAACLLRLPVVAVTAGRHSSA